MADQAERYASTSDGAGEHPIELAQAAQAAVPARGLNILPLLQQPPLPGGLVIQPLLPPSVAPSPAAMSVAPLPKAWEDWRQDNFGARFSNEFRDHHIKDLAERALTQCDLNAPERAALEYLQEHGSSALSDPAKRAHLDQLVGSNPIAKTAVEHIASESKAFPPARLGGGNVTFDEVRHMADAELERPYTDNTRQALQLLQEHGSAAFTDPAISGALLKLRFADEETNLVVAQIFDQAHEKSKNPPSRDADVARASQTPHQCEAEDLGSIAAPPRPEPRPARLGTGQDL